MISRWKIMQATQVLQQGGVIIYPTESIFGIGCDATNLTAVDRLLNLKQRSFDKGLILLVSDISQVQHYIQPLTAPQLAQINAPQTRATSWLLPAQKHVSPLIKGVHPKLAVRITRHPVAKALCQQLGNPIVSTSCNKSGKPVSTNAANCRIHWLHQVDHFIAGECGGQAASQIIDLESGKLIRV